MFVSVIVLPEFSSEPRFEPELGFSSEKFSSKFMHSVELNLKFSLGFKIYRFCLNLFEPPFKIV